MNLSILERPRKDGTTSFRAQVRVFTGKKLTYSEAQTFDRRPAAETWLELRKKELSKPDAMKRVKNEDPPLGEIIDKYIGSHKKAIGKTKSQVLDTIKKYDIANMRGSMILSTHLTAFADELAARGIQPQTVGNYLSHLSSVFKIAKPAWGYPLSYQEIQDARLVAKHQGTVGRSKQRVRRPTLAELDRLLSHFAERERRDSRVIPMTLVTMFAIFSTRRQEEICRIAIADLDAQHSEILVRDLKHPGEKMGNDMRTTLPPEAMSIVNLQLAKPRVQQSGRIFPYSSDAISRAFTDSCNLLGIEDLHFHDLRHDGISRLFEMGWQIPNVAMVSAHRTWTSLKRYTHIRHSGDKYHGWPWLGKLGISSEKA